VQRQGHVGAIVGPAPSPLATEIYVKARAVQHGDTLQLLAWGEREWRGEKKHTERSKLAVEEERNMEVSVMLSYWEREEREYISFGKLHPTPLAPCKFSFKLCHCTRVFSFPRSCSVQNLPSHMANLATNNLPVVHKIFSTSIVMLSHRVLGVVFGRKIAPS
jgi:hypothetical protein